MLLALGAIKGSETLYWILVLGFVVPQGVALVIAMLHKTVRRGSQDGVTVGGFHLLVAGPFAVGLYFLKAAEHVP